MKNRVTIIPSDSIIQVDNVAYVVTFESDAAIHAIQWLGEEGEIEFVGHKEPNKVIKGISDYAKYVKPYVSLWEAARQAGEEAQPAEEKDPAIRERIFNSAITNYLKTFLAEHDWESMEMALSQTGAFAEDAKKAQEAYDTVWAYIFDSKLKEKYISCDISIEDVVNALPKLTW